MLIYCIMHMMGPCGCGCDKKMKLKGKKKQKKAVESCQAERGKEMKRERSTVIVLNGITI